MAKFNELFRWQIGEYAWARADDIGPLAASWGPATWQCRHVIWRLWWVGDWLKEYTRWLNQPIVPTDPG